MSRTLHRISDPSQEILSPAEVRLFLKEDLNINDPLIDELTVSAREWLEDETGLNFGISHYELFLTSFIDIVIPRYPLDAESLTIKYTDAAGDEQTLAESEYQLIKEEIPARIKFGGSLPALNEDKEYPLAISFSAGYSPQKVPKRARTSMKLLITHYFNHRDLSDKRVDYSVPVPQRIRHFTEPLKKWRFL